MYDRVESGSEEAAFLWGAGVVQEAIPDPDSRALFLKTLITPPLADQFAAKFPAFAPKKRPRPD